MIHLFNKTEYSPFLQLSELNTQLSQTNQLKYAASAQPTQKSTAFTQLIRRSEKKTQHFYSFNAGLKKNAAFTQLFQKSCGKAGFYAELRLILARVVRQDRSISCYYRRAVKNKWELVNIFWLGQHFWLRFGNYMEWTCTLHFIKKLTSHI